MTLDKIEARDAMTPIEAARREELSRKAQPRLSLNAEDPGVPIQQDLLAESAA